MKAFIRSVTVGPMPTFSPRRFQLRVTPSARFERWKMLSWPAIVTAQLLAIDVRLPSTMRALRPFDTRSWLTAATNCDDSFGTIVIGSAGVAAAQPADNGEATDQTAANPATTSVVENVVKM